MFKNFGDVLLYKKINKITVIFLVLIVMQFVPLIMAKQNEVAVMQPYKEYFIEHVITEKDAVTAFKSHRNRLLNEATPAWCASVPCTQDILKYCLGIQMLHDHCCCDSRHGTEQLPWLPHSCYVGENCRPSIGSCIKYTNWRLCCCDHIIAEKWKTILSSSTPRHNLKSIALLPLIMLIYFICI